jgi:hypothetical protein
VVVGGSGSGPGSPPAGPGGSSRGAGPLGASADLLPHLRDSRFLRLPKKDLVRWPHVLRPQLHRHWDLSNSASKSAKRCSHSLACGH